MSNFIFTEKEYNALIQRLDSIQENTRIKLSPSEIIYDNADVLHLLKVSRRTLMGWRSAGKIGFHQCGCKIFYTQENINDFLQRHAIKRFA